MTYRLEQPPVTGEEAGVENGCKKHLGIFLNLQIFLNVSAGTLVGISATLCGSSAVVAYLLPGSKCSESTDDIVGLNKQLLEFLLLIFHLKQGPGLSPATPDINKLSPGYLLFTTRLYCLSL